jgi:hypothetical protein
MLIEWKCPFGLNGEPKLIDGKWWWIKSAPGIDPGQVEVENA